MVRLRTLTGWEYHHQALGHALRHTRDVTGGVPMMVTENGIATPDDRRRVDCTTGRSRAWPPPSPTAATDGGTCTGRCWLGDLTRRGVLPTAEAPEVLLT